MKTISFARRLQSSLVLLFIIFMAIGTPLFIWITYGFYAEDLIRILSLIEGKMDMPKTDLEEDIAEGVFVQCLMFVAFFLAIFFSEAICIKKILKPFEQILVAIENFRVEDGRPMDIPQSNIDEFARLGKVLEERTNRNMKSYFAMKEFVENASHELQTPLALLQSKLDLLIQDKALTSSQAEIIDELYTMCNHMKLINRDVLMLARLDNGQMASDDDISEFDLVEKVRNSELFFRNVAGDIPVAFNYLVPSLMVKGYEPLFDTVFTNLAVNAVRYSSAGYEINVTVEDRCLSVSNFGNSGPLDKERIFKRFFRQDRSVQGCGLGLALVKKICDTYGWKIDYCYTNCRHVFKIAF